MSDKGLPQPSQLSRSDVERELSQLYQSTVTISNGCNPDFQMKQGLRIHRLLQIIRNSLQMKAVITVMYQTIGEIDTETHLLQEQVEISPVKILHIRDIIWLTQSLQLLCDMKQIERACAVMTLPVNLVDKPVLFNLSSVKPLKNQPENKVLTELYENAPCITKLYQLMSNYKRNLQRVGCHVTDPLLNSQSKTNAELMAKKLQSEFQTSLRKVPLRVYHRVEKYTKDFNKFLHKHLQGGVIVDAFGK